MRTRGIAQTVGPAVLLAAGLLACASSPPPRFYILEATAVPADSASETGLTVVVGRVRLPEHLKREMLVSREERYRVSIQGYHRWAEPLEDNVASTLAENLSRLLPADRVVAYPESVPDPDFTVRTQIIEFGPAPSGDVLLRALWSVARTSGSEVARHRTTIREPRAGPEVLDSVAAMSTALARLSEEIVGTLREPDANRAP